MSFADVIGFIAGIGLSLFSFVAQLPEPSKADRTTVVRIGVGTSLNSDASTGDNIPGLKIWDVAGRYISGAYGSDTIIPDGSKADIELVAPPELGARQLQYLSITAGGKDAVCIAYIYATLPDNNQWTWAGDVGVACGGPWYLSQTIADNTGYQPKCVWINGDGMRGTGPNGIWTRGMGIHMIDFISTQERADAYRTDNRTMCESWPRFHMYDKLTMDDCIPYFNPPLEYNPKSLTDVDISKVMVAGSMPTEGCVVSETQPNTDTQSYRRSTKSRRQNSQGTAFSGRLITSSHPTHSAAKLCSSDTSVGPDFVSHQEGMFCDIETKQTYPLCDSETVDNCFDVGSKALLPPKGANRRDIDVLPRKDYHTVTN